MALFSALLLNLCRPFLFHYIIPEPFSSPFLFPVIFYSCPFLSFLIFSVVVHFCHE